MKTTMMSKATVIANKAVKGKQKRTTNPPAATRTKAANKKPTIYFANQQKENTWKYTLVLSWAIVVKLCGNSIIHSALETTLDKAWSITGRPQVGGDMTQPSSYGCPRLKTQYQYCLLRISQNTL
jgi:hypothetical protein